MYILRLVGIVIITLQTTLATAQNQTGEASFEGLNSTRISINKTGMVVLGSWGMLNTAAGATGYFIADDKEAKAFYGMNAIWGATNALIALGGHTGARKEAGQPFSFGDALHRYESNKRLYLINGGLDILYIGTGVYLATEGDNWHNPEMWNGFGKSFIVQGIFLLLFDGTMYALHQQHDKKWYQLLQKISIR